MTFEQIQQRAADAAKALLDYQYSSSAMALYNHAGFTARVDELRSAADAAERALAEAQHQNANSDLINSILSDAQANAVRLERERAAAQAERQAQQEAEFKRTALAIYTNANGSAFGFEDSWPALKAEFVKKHVLSKLAEVHGQSDAVEQFIAQMNHERPAASA